MVFSRYRNLNTLEDKKFYETPTFPSKTQLDAIDTFQIRVSRFDRLDILAFKHLGAGEYWWIISVMNDLSWAFSFEEGQILKIPVNLDDVLRLF
jgi:hypothetical protein